MRDLKFWVGKVLDDVGSAVSSAEDMTYVDTYFRGIFDRSWLTWEPRGWGIPWTSIVFGRASWFMKCLIMTFAVEATCMCSLTIYFWEERRGQHIMQDSVFF